MAPRLEMSSPQELSFIDARERYDNGMSEEGNTNVKKRAVTTSMKTLKESELCQLYSLKEVARHNSPDDCWLVIHGNVYDVTKWYCKNILYCLSKDRKNFIYVHDESHKLTSS